MFNFFLSFLLLAMAYVAFDETYKFIKYDLFTKKPWIILAKALGVVALWVCGMTVYYFIFA